MKRLNECSCGCGATKGGCNDNDANYMFFGNLKTIKKYVDAMLQMDPRHVQSILSDGHDWAADHIATSKDDIQEVGDFMMNEMQHEEHEMPGFAGNTKQHLLVMYMAGRYAMYCATSISNITGFLPCLMASFAISS